MNFFGKVSDFLGEQYLFCLVAAQPRWGERYNEAPFG
jgi:hypothetical protein